MNNHADHNIIPTLLPASYQIRAPRTRHRLGVAMLKELSLTRRSPLYLLAYQPQISSLVLAAKHMNLHVVHCSVHDRFKHMRKLSEKLGLRVIHHYVNPLAQ